MEERYWLRHPALRGLLGPYRLDELRTAIKAQSFPIDSYVLRDAGQDKTELQASPYWRPVTELLGMPAPAKPPTDGETDGEIEYPSITPARGHLITVRQSTAYQLMRNAVAVVAGISIVFTLISTLFVLIANSNVHSFATVAVALGAMLVHVLITLIVAGALLALFDLADCALRNDQRSQA